MRNKDEGLAIDFRPGLKTFLGAGSIIQCPKELLKP
jgi:hypothetical protein